jgi:hypothetical protein
MTTSSAIPTLYLYANGADRRMVFVDTVLRGLLGYRDGDPPPKLLRRVRRIRSLFADLRDVNERTAYMADWKEAFLRSPRLELEACCINNLVHYARCIARIRSYELIIVAHSAAGDDMTLLTRTAMAFQRRRSKLVMFIGNEYDLLEEKIAFMRSVGADYICSQLPIAAARYLYQECDGSRVLEMPHALNPAHYRPDPGADRAIDIGFIGDIYWPFVGDRERTDMIEWFERHGARHGLGHDIRKQRVTRDEWGRFLNRCKAVIGAESGTYYLNDRGRLLERARAYNLHENRGASFDEVFDRYYRGQPRGISGKSISSRHFEPIGTKTCQILLEGHYNGILQPDVHYICVRKDLSNIEDALGKFRDEGLRRRMVDETHEYVMAQHTYAHRVEHLLRSIG